MKTNTRLLGNIEVVVKAHDLAVSSRDKLRNVEEQHLPDLIRQLVKLPGWTQASRFEYLGIFRVDKGFADHSVFFFVDPWQFSYDQETGDMELQYKPDDVHSNWAQRRLNRLHGVAHLYRFGFRKFNKKWAKLAPLASAMLEATEG